MAVFLTTTNSSSGNRFIKQDTDISQIQTRTATQELTIRDLTDELHRLSLLCQAQWELLNKQFPNLTNQSLDEKINEIDLRDGKLDGQLKLKNLCKGCQRSMSAKQNVCLYCGCKTLETVPAKE